MITSASVMSSDIDFHRGEVLWALANTYPSLPLTLVEAAQNGIDAEATLIMIIVDLSNRTVMVCDNGNGVTKQQFEMALASVGKGVKDKNKLGRFGRGLIAPLNKCKCFTFTSCPSGSRKSLRWTFVGDGIREQHQRLSVPVEELGGLPTLSRRFQQYATDRFATGYRTFVELKGVTKDKVISLVDLDELESQVRQKLGRRMVERNVAIRVVLIDADGREQMRNINPIAYTGEALPVVAYHDALAGEVVFELYRAPKLGGVRRGKVGVMEADSGYPIPMNEFLNQARGGGYGPVLAHVGEALSSGYFEGVIRCKNIELHPERTRFEYTEPLQAFYLVLSDWHEQHGKGYFDDEQEVAREQRYQELGLKSQQRIREILINRPEYSRLWQALKDVVVFGRLGDGHVDPAAGQPDGFDASPSVRSGQGGAGVKRTPDDEQRQAGSRSRNAEDRPGDVPSGAMGPRGRRRQLVKGDSEGLWYEYAWLEGSSRLWQFDLNTGVLTFNVRHPIWVQLDESNGRHLKKNEKWIMQLQEWLTLELLSLLMFYQTDEALDEHRALVDTKIRPYVDLMIVNPR